MERYLSHTKSDIVLNVAVYRRGSTITKTNRKEIKQKKVNYIENKEKLLVTTSSTPGARASGRSGFCVSILETKGADVHP